MTSELRERIDSLYRAALKAPHDLRSELLAQAGPEVRQAVEDLLSQGDATSEATQTLSPPPLGQRVLEPGNELGGRFRIVCMLGKGGMGEVYRAEDRDLGGEVALKTLRKDLLERPEFLERFRREVQLARQVTHPNICRVFDVGYDRSGDASVVFLTMEYLAGETLAQRLRHSSGGKLDEAVALPLFLHLVKGLIALHELGIIHRDFKPGNVMLVPSAHGAERAVITDFGLARHLEADPGQTVTRVNQVMGTPDYMAPEQFMGQPASRQSDIFALGLVMYETLLGQKFGRHGLVVPPAPPSLQGEGVSARLEAVILRCLAPNPGDRPQSAAEILQSLRDPAAPVAVNQPAPQIAPQQRTRRAVLAAVLLLALLASGAWKLWFAGAALPQKKLIAVLPFQTAGEDRELQALSDGFAEILTSQLTQLEQLQGTFAVVPASEIRSRDINSVDQARKQYGVNLGITGSIQRLGKTLHFTANLVDAIELKQLRSLSFDAGQTDLPALRDGVIGRVVNMLEVRSTPQAEQALGLKETDRARAYFAYLEGRGFLHRFDTAGNVDRAIQSLEKALLEDPNYALAHAALGEAYWRKARSTNDKRWAERATASAQRAVQLGGSMAIPRIKLGEIYAQTGRAQQAIQEFQQALKIQPGNAEAHRGLGRAYSSIGLVREAEEAYAQAVRLRPTDWYAQNLLGVFYFGQGKYDPAEQAWKKASELTPDNDYPYRNLGMLYLYTGKFPQAKLQFEKSIAIKPSFLAHLGLGDLAYLGGRPSAAIEQYTRAIRFEPNNHLGWGGLGDAYTQLPGHQADAVAAYAKAIASCERKLAISPAAEESAYLASYHAKCGRKAEALEILSRAQDQPSLDLATRFVIALTHEVTGERRLAIEEFGALLKDGQPVMRIKADPYLKGLTSDAEFARVLQKYAGP